MGLDDFKGSGTCSVTRPNATFVSVNGSSVFAGNVAKLQGGAIAVQSGTLLLQVSHGAVAAMVMPPELQRSIMHRPHVLTSSITQRTELQQQNEAPPVAVMFDDG
jgi:predicted outer membrane repeat protein